MDIKGYGYFFDYFVIRIFSFDRACLLKTVVLDVLYARIKIIAIILCIILIALYFNKWRKRRDHDNNEGQSC